MKSKNVLLSSSNSIKSETIGVYLAVAVGLALMFTLPRTLDLYDLLQISLYVILAILALSQGFIGGFGGILCLGQSAFFGLGGYTYAVAVGNLGESTIPVVLAIAGPALFAAALGYFMFYGRISNVYVGVVTLTIALILFSFINATSGPDYRIGTIDIGGFNGIPNVQGLNIPLQPDNVLDPESVFYLVVALLIGVYVGLQLLLRTRFGRVLVGIRENERRAELIGFDVRLHKLVAFTIGSGIAGLAGCLFVSWGAFVNPNVFSMSQSAQIIIWVMVGGMGTLLGPIVGAILLAWLSNLLGQQQAVDPNIVFGAILLLTVLLLPRGIIPSLQEGFNHLAGRLSRRRQTSVAATDPLDGQEA